MAEETRRPPGDETRLAMALLSRKIVTESQLKAALDYQRSLGVRLSEALVKLSILRPAQLEELLAGGDAPAAATTPERHVPDETVLDPAKVSASDLKVHKKLLAKLPRDLVGEKLLVLFFPPPGISQRKIVLGHGTGLEPDVVKKVRSLIGVEICTLELERETAVSFLAANGYKVPQASAQPRAEAEPAREHQAEPPSEPKAEPEDAPKPQARPELLAEVKPRREEAGGPPPKSSGSAEPAQPIASSDFLVQALIGLLAKKGVITREELEMARIRRRAGAAVTVAP